MNIRIGKAHGAKKRPLWCPIKTFRNFRAAGTINHFLKLLRHIAPVNYLPAENPASSGWPNRALAHSLRARRRNASAHDRQLSDFSRRALVTGRGDRYTTIQAELLDCRAANDCQYRETRHFRLIARC
jgi:hypothetical protein